MLQFKITKLKTIRKRLANLTKSNYTIQSLICLLRSAKLVDESQSFDPGDCVKVILKILVC